MHVSHGTFPRGQIGSAKKSQLTTLQRKNENINTRKFRFSRRFHGRGKNTKSDPGLFGKYYGASKQRPLCLHRTVTYCVCRLFTLSNAIKKRRTHGVNVDNVPARHFTPYMGQVITIVRVSFLVVTKNGSTTYNYSSDKS